VRATRTATCRTPGGVEWVTLVVLGSALVVFGVWPRLILDAIDRGVGELLVRVSG
jgi:hypothetical protein